MDKLPCLLVGQQLRPAIYLSGCKSHQGERSQVKSLNLLNMRGERQHAERDGMKGRRKMAKIATTEEGGIGSGWKQIGLSASSSLELLVGFQIPWKD